MILLTSTWTARGSAPSVWQLKSFGQLGSAFPFFNFHALLCWGGKPLQCPGPAPPETLSNECAFLLSHFLFVFFVFFCCLSRVFVWCAQIIRLRKVESGTLCAEDVPQGAEHAPLAPLTCSLAHLLAYLKWSVICVTTARRLCCYASSDRVHLSLTNECVQPQKILNSCCFAAFLCFFKDSLGSLGAVRWDS